MAGGGLKGTSGRARGTAALPTESLIAVSKARRKPRAEPVIHPKVQPKVSQSCMQSSGSLVGYVTATMVQVLLCRKPITPEDEPQVMA